MKISQGNIYAKGSVEGSNNENTNDINIKEGLKEPNNPKPDINIDQSNITSDNSVINSNNSNKNTITNTANCGNNKSWKNNFWKIVCEIIVTVIGGLILYYIIQKFVVP